MTAAERIERALGAFPFGIFIVDADVWKPEEIMALAKARPGQLLMATAPHIESIRHIPPAEIDSLGCVAGFISDDDAEG